MEKSEPDTKIGMNMETKTDNFRITDDCSEFSPSTEKLQCFQELSVTRTVIIIVCRQAITYGQRIQFSNSVTPHCVQTHTKASCLTH